MVDALPYHVLVDCRADKIVVMGSHEPSLDLLCAYLKKWTRHAKDMIPGVSLLSPPLLPSSLLLSLGSWSIQDYHLLLVLLLVVTRPPP